MNSNADISVIFVCLGNICRSPTAEAVFRKKVKDAGTNIIVDSAGTAGWHVGNPPDKRMQAAAIKRNFDLSGLRARKFGEADCQKFDYIIAMDKQNLADLQSICPKNRNKIKLFLEYGSSTETEVPDPYYGGEQGFEKVLDLVENAAEALLSHIISQTR